MVEFTKKPKKNTQNCCTVLTFYFASSKTPSRIERTKTLSIQIVIWKILWKSDQCVIDWNVVHAGVVHQYQSPLRRWHTVGVNQPPLEPLEKRHFPPDCLWLTVPNIRRDKFCLAHFEIKHCLCNSLQKKRKKYVIYFPLNERQTLCDFLLPEFGLHLTSNSQVQQLIPQEQMQLQVWKRLILTRSPVLENQRREDEWQISQSDRTWCFHQRISAETLTTVLSKQWE